MLKNSMKLDAIAWKAKSVGQTYGNFSVSLSEKEKEQIFTEYEQMLERRKEEEMARLKLACANQAAKKNKREM